MRFVLSSFLLAAVLAPLAGCGGGPTQQEKEAAEKAPELDITESPETESKTEEERKGTTEAEPTKP